MRPFSVSLIFILVALNCSKVESNKLKKTESFVREWKVVRYPYSNAKLTILVDHKFSYHQTDHLSESYSEGIWSLKDDTLILNSLRPNDCLYIDDFSLINEESFDFFETTYKNCIPENEAKYFVEFNNSKFIILLDSLNYLHLDKDYKEKIGNYKIF